MGSIFVLFLFIFSFGAFGEGYDKELALKGGVGIAQSSVKALQGSEDQMMGYGFNTHFGYRFVDLEINLSSYIYWGKIDDLKFQGNGSSITGSGTYRHVSFGPVFKYFTPWEPINKWKFYLGVGPSWSLQSVKLSNFSDTANNFSKKFKLTYQSFGGFLCVGIEEMIPFKEMHPLFVEFLYSYSKSGETKVVDATDQTEVKTLTTEEREQEINTSYFMINFGMTFF